MKLIKLKMSNFMSHQDTALDFTTMGSPVLIKGQHLDRHVADASNAAGKSSIFHAIDYALFKSNKSRLRYGTAAGSVSLEFEHFGAKYLIIKEFTADAYSASLYKDGTIVSAQKMEIEKYMYNLIGMTRDLYKHTIYQNQKSQDMFGSASRQMKTDFIMAIMDISQWETYNDVAGSIEKDVATYAAKITERRDMFKMQAETGRTDLAAYDIPALNKERDLKVRLLEDKQATLAAYKSAEDNLRQFNDLSGQKARLENKIASADRQIEGYKSMLAPLYAAMADIDSKQVTAPDDNYKKNLLSSAMSVEKTIAAKEQEMKMRQSEIQDKEAKKPIILSQGQCPFCRKIMDDAYKVDLDKHLSGEILALKNAYTQLGSEYANLQVMRSSTAAQVAEMNAQVTLYNNQITTRKDTLAKIESFEALKNVVIEQNKKDREELTIVASRVADLGSLLSGNPEQAINTMKTDIAFIKTAVDNLGQRLMTAAQIQAIIDHALGQVAELEAELARYLSAKDLLRHVSAVTSINGIQKILITSALADITTLANSFLAPMNLSVFFQFEKSLKTKEGFKPVFDIMVMNNYKEACELEDLSGAEDVLVNFALRMALTTLIANKYDFKYMIIDEGIKDLDKPYKEFLAGVIKGMALQTQIFFITHDSDLSGEFTNSITVQKQNGIARVLT